MNLLPVYPLDGGQFLRELLGYLRVRDAMVKSLQVSIVTGGRRCLVFACPRARLLFGGDVWLFGLHEFSNASGVFRVAAAVMADGEHTAPAHRSARSEQSDPRHFDRDRDGLVAMGQSARSARGARSRAIIWSDEPRFGPRIAGNQAIRPVGSPGGPAARRNGCPRDRYRQRLALRGGGRIDSRLGERKSRSARGRPRANGADALAASRTSRRSPNGVIGSCARAHFPSVARGSKKFWMPLAS